MAVTTSSSFLGPPLDSYTPMTPEPRTRAIDATSTDPWGPSRSLMEEIRAYTQGRHRADVLHILHEALISHGTEWRRVHKALTIIAYCLQQGSNEVALFVTAHKSLILQLVHFEFVDMYRLDRGAAVREEARLVAQMLQLSTHPYPEAGPSSSAAYSSGHAQPIAPQHVSPYMPGMSWSPWSSEASEEAVDPSHESDRLSALLSHVDSSSDDEDTWLNIYKLLFLLKNALPEASDSVIRHWMQQTPLFKQLSRRRSPHSPQLGMAPEVRRLAGELADIFEARTAGEVRGRAKMF